MFRKSLSVFLTIFTLLDATCLVAQQRSFFISPNGHDTNPGSIEKPFLTIHHAVSKAEKLGGTDSVSINMLPGKYYLFEPLIIHALPFPLTISSGDMPGEVIISGAQKQALKWKAYKNGVFYARYSGKPVNEMYVNGRLYHMARYPDFDSTQRVFSGTAADAIAPARVHKWENPTGGYVHALHRGEWGGMHYKITGKTKKDELILEGGWQNNRPSTMNTEYRFVENIFEELNTEGEWFYKEKIISDTLVEAEIYCIPLKGVDLKTALVELTVLDELIVVSGSLENPVKSITIRGITFTQTNRTFMKTKEPLLRSDWTIFRGAAVRMEYAENCTILNCNFEYLGGNAIFISNYNRNHIVKGNLISKIGASGICLVGNPDAVRSPLFRYEESQKYEQLDLVPGPATDIYPSKCLISDNLIHHTGSIEKQSAGIEISMASEVSISYNTIYKTPRAGINISEGTWGGHIIEFNEVFNTVLETGDHGAFNSWGRDRYWNPNREYMDEQAAEHPEIILLDAQKTTIIRNNIFRCDHGWDIDLDDGSSNYYIYNNICLNGGLKLREGFNRKVENNILVNNTFHPHVWFKNSNDVFKHNIVTLPYAPIGIENPPSSIDSNFFISPKGLQEARTFSTDKHSLAGNPLFQDADKGIYLVLPGSEALKIGFKNFDTGIGVQDTRLKGKALKVPVPEIIVPSVMAEKNRTYAWMGATVKNIEGMGDRSAAGLPDEKGVLILNSGNSLAATAGLKKGDVIRSVEGVTVEEFVDFIQEVKKHEWTGRVKITIFRNQKETSILVLLK